MASAVPQIAILDLTQPFRVMLFSQDDWHFECELEQLTHWDRR
jgi:hypothetical protein